MKCKSEKSHSGLQRGSRMLWRSDNVWQGRIFCKRPLRQQCMRRQSLNINGGIQGCWRWKNHGNLRRKTMGNEVKLIQGKGHLCCRSRAGKKKNPASWGVGSTDDVIMSPRCWNWSCALGVGMQAISLGVAQCFLALPPFSSFGVRMFLLFHCFLKACSLICISSGLTFKRFLTPCTLDTGTGVFKLCLAWNPQPRELTLLVPEVLCKLLKERSSQQPYPAETLWTTATTRKDISKAAIVTILSWC